MEIDFNQPGAGDCNTSGLIPLGYENQQYYIQPKPNGYIAICHERDDLPPVGSLQVSAWSDQEIGEIYGFAVLYGWKGSGYKTTDACMVGIRREGSVTQAFYSSRVNTNREFFTPELSSLTLDNAPHTLRVVLYPDRRAFGYLDERLFVEHQFPDCTDGPIGILAWGPGDQKIYFDDLKLFELP
jgi:hypothetical protein